MPDTTGATVTAGAGRAVSTAVSLAVAAHTTDAALAGVTTGATGAGGIAVEVGVGAVGAISTAATSTT